MDEQMKIEEEVVPNKFSKMTQSNMPSEHATSEGDSPAHKSAENAKEKTVGIKNGIHLR